MKNKEYWTIVCLSLIILAGCGVMDKEQAREKIVSIEKELYKDTLKTPNNAVAGNAITSYVEYYKQFPDDEHTPEYLFKAAELSIGMQDPEQSLSYLRTLVEEYPNYEKAPMCLFLQAFIYETQLKNNAVAYKMYKEFIDKYPNHELADDATFALKNLGKSEEEIIKEFEQNSKTK